MRLDPRRPGAYMYVLGMIRFGLEQYESAARALQRAHEGNPENRVLDVPLVAVYASLGRFDDAQNALKRYTNVSASSTMNVSLIMDWWPFRRETDIRRFGGALIKAGLCCAEHLEKYIERVRQGGTLQ
ncbi:MAG: tetratricopeptide repeat protein [Gammaproteobacteria bacterium]|nr:tetratricopeptide repeat protein [Gammaproteobacteria bacterium]